jgi:hypothetical protein
MCIVVLATATESVPEVLVVLVAFRGLIARHAVLLTSLCIEPQSAGYIFRHTGRAAVTDEVPLVEQFDESVFAVAGYRARIADTSWRMNLGGASRRWAACETGV